MIAALLTSPAPDALLVRPYVQLGQVADAGVRSLSLVWQAKPEAGIATLRYGQGAGKWRSAAVTSRRVEMPTAAPRIVSTAVCAGLRPGEPVDYRLDIDGKTVAINRFMAPKSAKQKYRFAVFGDCGDATREEAMIAAQTLRAKPDMLVMTGDLVYDRGRISEYDARFWPYYTGNLPLMCRTLTVAAPGNHDILSADLTKVPDGQAYYYYWSQPLNGPIVDPANKSATPVKGSPEAVAAFRAAAGPNFPRMSSFSFDYGNAHWTFLDANPYVDWTDPMIRKWLADDLAKAKKATWRFVAFHQPGFHSSKIHQSEKQMRAVADIFEEGRVDVVFAGHVHNYQRTHPIRVGDKKGKDAAELAKDDWALDKGFDGARVTKTNGVIYVVDGAGGAHLYNPEMDTKPAEWKPFTAAYHATTHSVSVVDVAGKTFSLRQIAANGREIDRWTLRK